MSGPVAAQPTPWRQPDGTIPDGPQAKSTTPPWKDESRHPLDRQSIVAIGFKFGLGFALGIAAIWIVVGIVLVVVSALLAVPYL